MRTEYEAPYCFLHFDTPFQLLVAVILSAQCTDAMVNQVTPALFANYPDAASLAKAPRADIERIVFRTGFYRAKAKHIQETAQAIVERFGGDVPRAMGELTSLPGVARKTANVVQAQIWGSSEGVCVDTHVGRVARRLGLTRADDATKVEEDLMRLYPSETWVDVPYYFIRHGRAMCDAKRPRCGECPLADLCPKQGVPRELAAGRGS
jgi:endonuclease-3